MSTPDSPKGKAVSHFKKLAEQKTRDQVRVDIYPDGLLYDESVALEAVQLGAIHMLAPSLSRISALGLHEFDVFDLPYLFPDEEALYRITQGSVGQSLLNKLETKGIVGLGIWDNGFKSMFSNTPIHTPEDMRGLVMRTDPSHVLATQMKTLGATPYSLTFPNVVELMQKRIIDGTENTPSNFYFPDLNGTPKYVAITNHGYLGYAVIVNKKFWINLPPHIRVQLRSAANETTAYANSVAQQHNAISIEAMKESDKVTVYELTDAEKMMWQDALLSVPAQMEHRIGKELMHKVTQVITNPHD